MIESKAWNWEIVKGRQQDRWLEPSMESYYLLHRWKGQGKEFFLDLGCGLGRHTILFAQHGFKTSAFDLSEEAIHRTEEYAKKEGLDVDFKIGDMLDLPYKDEEIDLFFVGMLYLILIQKEWRR